MNFNFHVMAHTAEVAAEDIAKDIKKAIQDAGHVVDKILYTDDNGQRELNPVIQDVADAVEVADPAMTPVVNEGEAILNEIDLDIHKLEGTTPKSGTATSTTHATSPARATGSNTTTETSTPPAQGNDTVSALQP